jgi:hypothetical protein
MPMLLCNKLFTNAINNLATTVATSVPGCQTKKIARKIQNTQPIEEIFLFSSP